MTLSNENVAAIDRIFMINGSGPDIRAKVASQFGITEAFAGAVAKVLKEKRDNITEAAPSRAITEAGAPAGALNDTDPRKVHLAVRLQTQVQTAEAKPINECSIQELEALTAAAAAEAGMFG